MATLHEVLRLAGSRLKSHSGTFGIEIETEVKVKADYPDNFLVENGSDEYGHVLYKSKSLPSWTPKTDGSLRNFGIEYVFKEPLSFKDTLSALVEFADATKDVPFLKDQPSTSVHVHMNFMDETLLTMANFITIWTHFENILLEYSGPTRRSNLFAVGVRHADYQSRTFTRMFAGLSKGEANSVFFQQQQQKYAALNIATLGQFGSLEARCFRGTTDVTEIMRWVSILNKMMEFARLPGLTPLAFAKTYFEKGEEILTDVFGEYSNDLKCEDYLKMMERQEKYLYDIVLSIKDWNTFGLAFDLIQDKKKSKKSLADVSFQPMTTSVLVGTNSFYPNESTVILDEMEDEGVPY